jgi:hypothetical protein
MKKLLLLVIVFSMICISTYSQVTVGGKAGINIASVSGDYTEDFDPRLSIHIGGYSNFAFSENLSLQPEIVYNGVGFTNSGNDAMVTGN